MILVVCTGNTCRSPMAEGLLRHHLAGANLTIPVRSAGTLGWNGRPATPHAVEVMAERGIDISAHHSVKMATADVVAADLVLVMTRVHGGAINAHCAARTQRTFLPDEVVRLAGAATELPLDSLSAWAEHLGGRRPAGPLGRAQEEVADPAGEPIDAYRTTADRLERTIVRLVQALGALGGVLAPS